MMASETKPTNRAMTATEPRRNGRPMRIARNDAGKAVKALPCIMAVEVYGIKLRRNAC
jgi:hypothetical protein